MLVAGINLTKAINILARIENDGKPTQELGHEIRKLHEAFTYWNTDVAAWEKHKMVIPTKPMEDYINGERDDY